jgi:CCR4-NOT transcriptional regulation complex NOT5 subunit
MGYLGSSLDDYYSYQLLDKVAEQIDSGDIGSIEKLQKSLKKVIRKLNDKRSQIKEDFSWQQEKRN